MAKYGYTLYGLRRYGELEGDQVYYRSGLRAFAYDYGKVFISWGAVNVDPNDLNPTHWRLIRTQNGVPDNPDLGTVLAGGPISSFNVAYTDSTADTVAGQEVYYSLWFYNTIDWINCGSDTAFVLAKSDTLTNVLRRLPAAWLNEESGVGDATGNPESSNQLVQLLSAYTYEYDRLRLQIGLLQNMSDYRQIPQALLPIAVLDRGMPYEPTLGDYAHRSLYRVGHLVNATKGTSQALTSFTSALTHWGSSVVKGTNLMLDYNDSSFEESKGHWAVTNATIEAKAYADSLTDLGAEITMPTPPLYDRLFPPLGYGYGLVTSNSTNGITLSLGNANPKTYGIPVKGSNIYTFKGWGLALDTAKAGTASITWYSATGAEISTTTPAAINFATTWSTFQVSGLAPRGSVYAGIHLTIASTATSKRFVLDLMQFSLEANADRYEDARTAHVQVQADRTNYLPNPGFDNGLSGWDVVNGSYVQDFNSPAEALVFGAANAKVSNTGAGDPVFVSEWVPVLASAPITFSAFVTADQAGRTAVARIEFTTTESEASQITVLADEDGQYFPTVPEIVTSADFNLHTDAATRVFVSTKAPAAVADNGQVQAKVSIFFPDSSNNDNFWIDACLLESHPDVRAYFQGNGGPQPVNPVYDTFVNLNDCRWEWREQLNLVSNPNFDSTTGWTANSGTTISSVSTGGGYNPFAGGHMMKVNRTTAGTAKVTTTVTLDRIDTVDGDVYGGDDVVVTARVIGLAGDYTIDINGAHAKTFTVSSTNKDQWTTLHTNFITTNDQATFDINITHSGSGAYYVDAVQAEYGRVAGPFVDNSDQAVTTRANNNDGSKTVWQFYGPQTGGGGRSYYWARYYNKYERLKADIPVLMPLGSTWAITSGEPTPGELDTNNSLLSRSSFESGLYGWHGDSAALTRVVSGGSHLESFGASGSAWMNVTSTASSTFGVHADAIDLIPNAGYYAAVAIKPSLAAIGDFTLKVDWTDDNGTVLWTTEETATITHPERWAYIGLTSKNIQRVNGVVVRAAQAVLSVTCDATTPATGITFSLDRVIFRQ